VVGNYEFFIYISKKKKVIFIYTTITFGRNTHGNYKTPTSNEDCVYARRAIQIITIIIIIKKIIIIIILHRKS